jgi:hypothetical protein
MDAIDGIFQSGLPAASAEHTNDSELFDIAFVVSFGMEFNVSSLEHIDDHHGNGDNVDDDDPADTDEVANVCAMLDTLNVGDIFSLMIRLCCSIIWGIS